MDSTGIYNYIEFGLKKGISPEQLKAELISKGVNEVLIDKTMTQVTAIIAATPTPPPAGSVSKRVYPIISINRIRSPYSFYALPIIGGLVKNIMLIPQEIMLWFASLALGVALFINAFVVLFTGKYWQPAYNWVVRYVHLSAKINFFRCGLTDKYPDFTFSIQDSFFVDIPYPVEPNRIFAVPFFGIAIRFIMIIPFLIFSAIISCSAWVMVIFSAIVVLFKKYYPESTFEFVKDSTRLSFAGTLYFAGISDTYPTFKISKNHLLLKSLFIIPGTILMLISIISSFSPQKSSPPPRIESRPTPSVSQGIKDCYDVNCFLSLMEQNKKVRGAVHNYFVVDGIAFTQLVLVTFEGYSEGKYVLSLKPTYVNSTENIEQSSSLYKTVENVKKIGLSKSMSCNIFTPDFNRDMRILRSDPLLATGNYPQGIYACVGGAVPDSAKQVNEFVAQSRQRLTPTQSATPTPFKDTYLNTL